MPDSVPKLIQSFVNGIIFTVIRQLTITILVDTLAKDVMFSLAFVCLYVCVFVCKQD